MARNVEKSLDISHRQVLVDFFEDENQFWWHHRVLFIKGDGSGEWIAATPSLSIQMVDLRAHRVIPLDRHTDIGAEFRGRSFLFDPPLGGRTGGVSATCT